FQAEDGIRDATVTGVQTCALPISRRGANELGNLVGVLKFRAIYLDNRAGIPKQDLRRRFDDAGLSRARRPEKEEVSYGAARRVRSEERRVGKGCRERVSASQ